MIGWICITIIILAFTANSSYGEYLEYKKKKDILDKQYKD